MAQHNRFGSNSNASLIDVEEMLGVLHRMIEAQKQSKMAHTGMMSVLEQINMPRS